MYSTTGLQTYFISIFIYLRIPHEFKLINILVLFSSIYLVDHEKKNKTFGSPIETHLFRHQHNRRKTTGIEIKKEGRENHILKIFTLNHESYFLS